MDPYRETTTALALRAEPASLWRRLRHYRLKHRLRVRRWRKFLIRLHLKKMNVYRGPSGVYWIALPYAFGIPVRLIAWHPWHFQVQAEAIAKLEVEPPDVGDDQTYAGTEEARLTFRGWSRRILLKVGWFAGRLLCHPPPGRSFH